MRGKKIDLRFWLWVLVACMGVAAGYGVVRRRVSVRAWTRKTRKTGENEGASKAEIVI